MEPKKSYYAVIPANVRYDNEISANAKLLYGEISALCNDKGFCWATNAYFANLYSVHKKTVSEWIKQLSDRGYVTINVRYVEGTKEVDSRCISIVPPHEITETCPSSSSHPPHKNTPTPIREKAEENTTVVNNTVNKEKYTKRKDTFVPPTLGEVIAYAKERNATTELAQKFFDYFTADQDRQWVDSKGKPVLSWKQKFVTWQGTTKLKEDTPWR